MTAPDSTLQIRPYGPADEEAAVAVWAAATVVGHPFLSQDSLGERERELRRVYLVEAQNWVGIDESGRIVGLLGLLDHDDGRSEVGGLFVHPDSHDRGYGRALLEHAGALKGALRLDVFERNDRARAFYAHMGFTEIGRLIHETSGFVLIRMARDAPR